MATLPSIVPTCQRCKTANLKVVEKEVGEGIYKRKQNQVHCKNCGFVQDWLAH